jgi:hypothetical protein
MIPPSKRTGNVPSFVPLKFTLVAVYTRLYMIVSGLFKIAVKAE